MSFLCSANALLTTIILLLSLGSVHSATCGSHTQITKLTAADASGADANGYSVDVEGVTIVTGAYKASPAGYGSGAVYVFQESELGKNNFMEVAKLVASDGAASDYFGNSVSISGVSIAVGAEGDDDGGSGTGSVYVFQESFFGEGDWIQAAKLLGDSTTGSDDFGWKVDIQGTVLAVGAARDYSFHVLGGAVYIFSESATGAGDFIQRQVLSPMDAADSHHFGHALDMDGVTLVSSAIGYDSSKGMVYVFQASAFPEGQTDFAEVAQFQPVDLSTNDKFGESVSTHGTTIAVGAYWSEEVSDPDFKSGSVYVYRETALGAGDYSFLIKLLHSDETGYDNFGSAVAVSGMYIAVSATGVDSGSVNTAEGAIYMFRESVLGAGDYVEFENRVMADDGTLSDKLGFSMAMRGSLVVAGALVDEFGTNSGAAYVFDANCTYCDSSPCLNSGRCKDTGLGYGFSCVCEGTGFIGDTCQTDLIECDSDPCLNGGTCTDGVSFFCDCTGLGYTGDQCQTDVDDCLSSPCLNNGTCADAGTFAYACNCTDTGFMGLVCETDVNDCLSSPCLNGGVCTDAGANTFSCECLSVGYMGEVCQTEIDDCGSSPCAHDGICTDLGLRAFSCDCSGTGYEGDTCESDVNDCLSSPCFNGGACTDAGVNAHSCNCNKTGFEGQYCESDVDDCLSQPCFNEGVCLDQGTNAFFCDCNGTGFEGHYCESDVDDCLSQPCLNGGSCVDALNAFSCDCNAVGFDGPRCEADANDCLSMPCENGGSCVDAGLNMFECVCSSGYSGSTCNVEDVTCLSAPCENGGICMLLGSSEFSCNCNGTGFTGTTCSAHTAACLSGPCQNSGACIDFANSFLCECGTSYYGDVCQFDSTNSQSNEIVIVLSFSSFTNQSTGSVQAQEVFLTELKYILAADVGGSPSEYSEVELLTNDDGSYTVSIVYANEDRQSIDTVQRKIEDVGVLEDYVNDPSVRLTAAPTEDDSENDEDGQDSLPAVIVIACCTLLILGLMYLANRYLNQTSPKKLPGTSSLTMPA